ncbi:hypothetical protein COCNU_scaffold000210G000050 [Cocos nucifera]|nr:hypothetical protein [Cocos nucifera]
MHGSPFVGCAVIWLSLALYGVYPSLTEIGFPFLKERINQKNPASLPTTGSSTLSSSSSSGDSPLPGFLNRKDSADSGGVPSGKNRIAAAFFHKIDSSSSLENPSSKNNSVSIRFWKNLN